MKYKSCHLIEHGISINVDSIQACCLSREFDKGMLPITDKYENSSINWDELFEIKKRHRKHQKIQDLKFCEGCYISFINFDHWSHCNSNCIYCGVQKNKPRQKNNVLNSIKELIQQGKFKNTGEITFQGGEPTILKEFEDLLKLFIKAGSKVRIHSSGIKFSRAIREGIKKGAVTVVISPDAADCKTYKAIKRVDKFNNVWANIKHYRRWLPKETAPLVKVKYIIIPGINDSFEDITNFLNKIKKLDIKSIVTDVEYTYANQNINNISPHIYMLMDYMENFAKENQISYELYDSAKYAEQNRHIEKTLKDHLNSEYIEKIRKLNQDKNINYSNF